MSIFSRKKRDSETIKLGAKLITVAKPQSPVSEQFRTIRTNIKFMSVDRKIKSLAFTSANMTEGKSTVTANVAITYAQAGLKTLLIDSDLRRPTVHSTFEVNNSKGLTTILTSDKKEISLDDIVKPSGVDNLYVLTSGPVPPNPSELIGSKRMRDLVTQLKDQYDMVIIDMPPVLEVSDTQELAGYLDGVVLVVRQGVTQKPAIKRTVELLKIAKANILGYVMNDVSAKNGGYGYGYGYGYGQKKKHFWERLKK